MKLKTRLVLTSAIASLCLVLFITACKKETSSSSGTNAKRLSVFLTDDPCNFDSVLIDIRYVEVKIDTSSAHMNDDHYGDDDDNGDDDHEHSDRYGKWDTLTIRQGVYNVMKFRNGIDTLLGTANLPAGRTRKMRLTLGNNNSVVVSGVRHPLNLLPGTNSYAYVKLHDEDHDDVNPTQSSLWLDFDVCQSIRSYNGQYYLKPVLKPFGINHFGSLEGKVLPSAAKAFVQARNATDSATALPESDGEYKIRGLAAGTYSVTLKGSNGYRDTTLTNLVVRDGQETHVPTVTLRQ
ncbi:MAG TPA: DUF4382 domain-containing protein [Flavisolibacter sp.]